MMNNTSGDIYQSLKNENNDAFKKSINRLKKRSIEALQSYLRHHAKIANRITTLREKRKKLEVASRLALRAIDQEIDHLRKTAYLGTARGASSIQPDDLESDANKRSNQNQTKDDLVSGTYSRHAKKISYQWLDPKI